MCEECRQYPHDPRCPNAPPPRKAVECSLCGEDILQGDDYCEVGEYAYCMACIWSHVKSAGDYLD